MSAVRLLPWTLHTAIEYLAGIFLILSAFIFGFTDEAAFGVFVAVGIAILVLAAVSDSSLAVVGLLPASVHSVLDYVVGLVLLVGPWVFGYRDVREAMAISVILGVAHLIITFVTRFPEPDAAS